VVDEPLCGDPTCEGPGCRQSAIDAWYERMEDEAKAIVQGWFKASLGIDVLQSASAGAKEPQ
jgi:hypothetical protein